MIGPKIERQTKAQEDAAYELATLRDLDTCQRCRRNCGPTARDHRKGRGVGGQTTAANLQVLGLRCHQWKTEHPAAAFAEGWAVPGWADPLTYPGRRWFRSERGMVWTLGWVLYRDDGRFLEINEDEALRRIEAGRDA